MDSKHFNQMHKFLKRNQVNDGFVWRRYACDEVTVDCKIPFADLTKGEKEPTHWECEYQYDGLVDKKSHTFEQMSDYFEKKFYEVRNKQAELFYTPASEYKMRNA